MHEMRYDDWDMTRNEIMGFLKGKRNLMVYDGVRDGLDENVDYRFFYSSPGDTLEFVIGDMFRDSVDVELDRRSFECFGRINIIREPGCWCQGFVECLFGVVLIEKVKVREIDKVNIILNLSIYGIKRLKEAVEYFEKSFCVKGND